MKFDKQKMIADFLEEMEELNKPTERPERVLIEVEFAKLLQHNVYKGFYGQDYCGELSNALLLMSDEMLFEMYDEMKNKFPNLEV